jgi:hypothetical protein
VTQDEKAAAALIAIGVQIGFAVSGKILMDPERQASQNGSNAPSRTRNRVK